MFLSAKCLRSLGVWNLGFRFSVPLQMTLCTALCTPGQLTTLGLQSLGGYQTQLLPFQLQLLMKLQLCLSTNSSRLAVHHEGQVALALFPELESSSLI